MDWVDYREKLGIGFCDEQKFKHLKIKVFNILNAISSERCVGCIEFDEYLSFCNITGTPMNSNCLESYQDLERFRHCLYVIDKAINLPEFLAYYVAFTNSIKSEKMSKGHWTRSDFVSLLCNKLNEAHIPFDLLENNGEFFVFPKGAKEMDAALVSQPLSWLSAYPKSHTAFVKALKQYSEATAENASDVADLFRKALETFFQEFFNCNKSLESCKGLYGGYLKNRNVPSEIAGNFETLLQAYTNFMNGYAKHHDKSSLNVLEYVMYQTGNIIRLLITLKQEVEKQ